MQRLLTLLIFFLVFLHTSSFAQDSTRTMRSFVPQSKAYDMYYPLDFQLREDGGIVTITDTLSGLNITVSSYYLKDQTTDSDIITLLNSFINETYNKEHKPEDWSSYFTKFDNLVELKTYFEHTNWIWYGINHKSTLVVLSLNKATEFTQEDVNLTRFMIDNLVIN